MRNYFGFFVYDNNRNKIEGRLSRPYFRNSYVYSYDYDDYPMGDKWRAYILPHDIPDTDSDGQPDAQDQRLIEKNGYGQLMLVLLLYD